MDRRRRTIALLAMLATSPAGAQVAVQGAVTTSLTGVCVDKVSMPAFTWTPAAPVHGQTVTAKATLKNGCSGGAALDVPWKIVLPSGTVTGTATGVAPGASVVVTATWTARAGRHGFDAEVDPANTLNESSTQRQNNLAPGNTDVTVVGAWSAWTEPIKSEVRHALEAWAASVELTKTTVSVKTLTTGTVCCSRFTSDAPGSQVRAAQLFNAASAVTLAKAATQAGAGWVLGQQLREVPVSWPVPSPTWRVGQRLSLARMPLPSAQAPSVATVAQQLRTALGAAASEPGASATVDAVAALVVSCAGTYARDGAIDGGALDLAKAPAPPAPFVPVPVANFEFAFVVARGALKLPAC